MAIYEIPLTKILAIFLPNRTVSNKNQIVMIILFLAESYVDGASVNLRWLSNGKGRGMCISFFAEHALFVALSKS